MFQKIKNIFKSSKPFGLDISDYSIEIVSLSGSVENPKLSAIGRTKLPSSILENGKIINKEDLEKFLKNLILKPNFGKVESREFIFSVPEWKSFTYIFDLPVNLKKEEIPEFIESQAIHHFPYPLEEISFDFQLLNSEVLLVAIPKGIVNDYLEVFRNCQISPLVLETESLSLAGSLIGKTKKLILISDIGAKMTNFCLFDAGKLKLSISSSIAGNRFLQAISEKLKIPFPQAEKLKMEIGLNPRKKEGRIFLILQQEIQKIIEEIRNIEDYYQKKTARNIEEIILTGGSALLPNLAEYLSENLEKEVSIGDPWSKIKVDNLEEDLKKTLELEIEPVLYSTAVGLALRGLEKNPQKAGINLLKGVK